MINEHFHNIYIKAHYTVAPYTKEKSSFSVGTAPPIVKFHLLLNRFGGLCLYPAVRRALPMLTTFALV